MVINLRRYRKSRADKAGYIWHFGLSRRTYINMHRYRVFLDGREVTERTFYVDSRRGRVRLYQHDSDGKKHTVPDGEGGFELAWAEVRGHVRLVRRWGH